MTLRLAPGLTLPDDILTEALGIVANRGSGKTYTSKKLVELMTELGLPTCVIDPLGVWYGLRSSADGKKAGLPFIVFGGKHGDVPLKPTHMQEADYGRIIAQWLLENPVPVILDLSELRKAAQRRFVSGFLEELYEGNENPLHVVVDECDIFCPQKPSKDFPPTLLGIMEDVVRRGRSKGLGITLISQRPAVINKDVLSQISTLICLRLFGPQDRSAIRDWIGEHGTPEERKEVMDSLQSLPVGEGWFYSPGFLGILRRFKAYPARTFDSSATPKLGERRIEPKMFAPVDLDALSDRIKETAEKAKQNDPKHLRAVIAQHKTTIATLQELVGEQDAEIAELKARPQAIVEVVPSGLPEAIETIAEALQLTQLSLLEIAVKAKDGQTPVVPVPQVSEPSAPPAPSPRPVAPPVSRSEPFPEGSSDLPKVEKEILTVLAQNRDGRMLSQIALLTGRSSKSGGFKNGLSSLRTAGLIVGSNREIMRITPEGLMALGPFDELPTGRALFEHWLTNLGRAERACLQVLADHWPNEMSIETLAEPAGYSSKSGGYKNALSRLRTLGLIEGPNSSMKASDMLFENGDWR